ncbi:Na+/H+ antiporter NhaC family protein [Luteithermobacter gelatinilyticus]|uniref:Na+/H+ antiporter NhaC family protein n=1 Tax=Luteithermobacter gelatinilyticus TaxID=2582913 RepID=UPI001107035B|nr:Na+/H+ antiporter NhaC family protein [Luteithermobacter gelatinilyticus]|tara:strand:- start:2601 stop:3974 length:1374 start_codon:yes stop_codon:yes gene_type:complete
MDWVSILPPVVAIIIVVWRREVILSLFLALLTSEVLLVGSADLFQDLFAGFLGSLERIVAVFQNEGNTRILMFSLLVGALLAYLRQSGGVSALVERLINRGLTRSRRQVGLMTTITGLVLFIESNLSVLTAGIVSRGLFDKFGMSRARLAYIIDSTSAPVCILLLLNGWGAYVLGLLGGYDLADPVGILIGSIPLNFYALVTLALVFYTVLSDRVYGPLARADSRAAIESEAQPEIPPTRARYMILPLMVMIGGIFGFMIWTGEGDITKGDGARAILYATILACLCAYILMLLSRRFTHHELVKTGFQGMGELLPLVTIVLLSMALGSSLKLLGTGTFIAGLAGAHLPLFLIVPMLFLAGSLISFTTGTSWGTFALLIPLGMPLIDMLGLPPALVLSAILGGGVFGDHCSPISDTTAVSSIAAGCDLLEHVRTQLPYALTAGGISFGLYILASLVML